MMNIVIGTAVLFLVFRGIKAYFNHDSGCCGSCAGCKSACSMRK